MKDELLEAVDKAAEALLQKATSEVSLADLSLGERTKAFEAVAKWAQFRGGPPPKEGGKERNKGGSGRFGALRERYNAGANGAARGGRRGRPAANDGEGAGDEAAGED